MLSARARGENPGGDEYAGGDAKAKKLCVVNHVTAVRRERRVEPPRHGARGKLRPSKGHRCSKAPQTWGKRRNEAFFIRGRCSLDVGQHVGL